MLVRELVARYLGTGATIRVDADPEVLADPELLADVESAGPVVDLQGGGDPVPGDVVVISVDPAAHTLPDRLALVAGQDVTVMLVLPICAADLPVGRLAQAARTARLAFVEIAPIEPCRSAHTVVVCRTSNRPVAVQPYLGDGSAVPDEIDLASQGLRIGWEWGLGDARARAVEERGLAALTRVGELEQELTEVRGSLDQAGRDLEVAHGVAERAESRADAEAKRRGALQQSSAFLVGRAMLTMRRHPLRGSRQLLGAIRRSVRKMT